MYVNLYKIDDHRKTPHILKISHKNAIPRICFLKIFQDCVIFSGNLSVTFGYFRQNMKNTFGKHFS